MRRTLLALLLLAIPLAAAADCPASERIAQMAADWCDFKPIADLPPVMSMADAECTQARLLEKLAGRLGRPVGYKAGQRVIVSYEGLPGTPAVSVTFQ